MDDPPRKSPRHPAFDAAGGAPREVSAHNCRRLVARWRAVSTTARLRLRRFARCAAGDVYFLATPSLEKAGGIYISAGIHGDEPASSEALITWAERRADILRELPLMLFPCLNPWGLAQNIRLDENGIDLNRAFNTGASPVIEALKRVIAPHRFDLGLCLHEDYDAEGIYLYEVQRRKPHWGEALLKLAARVIPVDPRERIDGRVARGGLIRRRIDMARFDKIGHPEAVYLHRHHAVRALTVETPSEAALELRVAAHIVVIEECVRRVCGEFPARDLASR